MKNSSLWIGLSGLVIFFAFSNCSQDARLQLTSLKSEALQSVNASGGGDGYGFGGKPGELYYRFLPEFTCEGGQSALATISVLENSISYTQNDPLKCNLNSQNIESSDLDVSPFQKEIFGYKEGIYEHFPKIEQSIIPSTLTEVWCQSLKDPSDLELLIKFDRKLQKAFGRVYFSQWNTNQQKNENRTVPDFEIARVAIDHKVLVLGDKMNFEVNRDELIPGDFGQFSGKLSIKIDEQLRTESLRCRLGSYFDPNIWPTKIISNIDVHKTVKISSERGDVPHHYGFFSYENDNNTNTYYNISRKEIYLFSDKNRTPQKIGFSGQERSEGFQDFKISPDGKYIYYRSDSKKPGQQQLFQKKLENGETRVLGDEFINGLGILSIYKGGFHVYSDGTLLFINENRMNQKMELFYIPGADPGALPKKVEKASVGAQSFGYGYSALLKKILFTSMVTDTQRIFSYQINTHDVQTGKTVKISEVPNEGLIHINVATSYFEFNDTVYFKTIKKSISGDLNHETYLLNVETQNQVSLGLNPTALQLSPDFSMASYILNNVNTLYNFPKDKKIEWTSIPTQRVFSGTSLWWSEDKTLYVLESHLQNKISPCLFSKDDEILEIIPRSDGAVSILVYNQEIGLLKAFNASATGTCLQVNSLPFSKEIFQGFLSSKLSPSNDILAVSVNIGSSATDSTLMVYIIPLNGAPSIAATAPGLGSGNKIHGNQIQMFFSHDSSRLYFVGFGWARYYTKNKTLVYSFETPKNLKEFSQ